MASPSSVSRPPTSQYHHFIPRFILRNFAHQPEERLDQSLPKKKKRRNQGHRGDDPLLYTLDLSTAAATIKETPVSRTSGLTDMYRDFANSTNQHYLEEELSKLESRAATVLNKIRKAFEAGDSAVWIVRQERDILRKFLFIMKYRATNMHQRFYHDSVEGYSADDRHRLLDYMRRKGFTKPIDVWFDNIKAMLELKMDPTGKWMEELEKRIYPDDAKWFVLHTQGMYLALCTPSADDEEFLLPENAYGIHEGPVSVLADTETGEIIPTVYTEYHKFAVITPRLMMVLRSFLLPLAEEDENQQIRDWRETAYKLNAGQHNNPETAYSVLADLPIRKPRNSYSTVVEGGIRLLDGEDGTPRANHKFCFRFFPLETRHVDIINDIMLEQSIHVSNVVFRSRDNARRALEHYLTLPPEKGFKVVTDQADDPRLYFLQTLERGARDLGSSVQAMYHVHKVRQSSEEKEAIFVQALEKALPKEPTEFMQLYTKLGGSPRALAKDMDQAQKMLNMRIKIDVWTQGLNEDFREATREQVRDFFCQLPARRVWIYLKHVRCMLLQSPEAIPVGILGSRDGLDGPEDTIVKGTHDLVPRDKICRLMWYATLNDIYLQKHPDFNLRAGITLDETRFRRLQEIKTLAFGPAGSICDCAIPAIAERAGVYRTKTRNSAVLEGSNNRFWSWGENVEMVVRIRTQRDMSEVLGSAVSKTVLVQLKKVLFGIVYPFI